MDDRKAGFVGSSSKRPAARNSFWQSLALRRDSVQPKLKISQPGDVDERQADQFADRVMSSADPESRIANNLGAVRIHSDSEAAKAADAIGARAFTTGRDIVLGAGEYQPATPEGQRLIAHELAHVNQQATSGVAIQRTAKTKGDTVPTPDVMEQVTGSLWAYDEKGNRLLPSLDDIRQSDPDDCYVLAAMAGIVNTNPEKLFTLIEDHGDDTYTVTFEGIGFFSKAKQKVTAEFPVGKHALVGERKAIWPLVIEKAYAQQKGGYDKIGHGGYAGNVLDELLNESADYFKPHEETVDYIMAKVLKAKNKKWPMTIWSQKKDLASTEKIEAADDTTGLYFWHTYTIIDVDGKENRLKLFNPWGRDHPNGDGWLAVEKVKKFFIGIQING